jgi:hypothetical protein
VYVFCIDTSPRAISSGAMSASLVAVKHTVDQLYKWATGKTSAVTNDLCAELNEVSAIILVDFTLDSNVLFTIGCLGKIAVVDMFSLD